MHFATLTGTHVDAATLLLAVALLLITARVLGELAERLGQATVVGEILAGVLLGPSFLGKVAPGLQAAVFPIEGPVPISLQAIGTLAITLFLLVAGMEIDLSSVWRQGRVALWLAAIGIVVPFATGFVPAYFWQDWMSDKPGVSRLVFALFFATAMSITALPVLAKILFDLKLLRSDMGVVLIAAAILNDLVGWLIFVFVLSLMQESGSLGDVALVAGAALLFTVLLLTLGRGLLHRTLPFIQAHTSWPGGILGFAVGGALLCAAFTEYLGIHAVFGSFMFGVALGDSPHLRKHTRAIIERFVNFLFAPLFFASIGLRVDFVEHFDLGLVMVVLLIASLGKVLGCGLAARELGFVGRQSMAIGFGMNARGAMEIILGLIALRQGIIGERLFVALVIMALVTSATTSMAMQRILAARKPVRFIDFVNEKTFVPSLHAQSAAEALIELSDLASKHAGVEPARTLDLVQTRERIATSALGVGLALPHARIHGLKVSVIAAGLARGGLDFGAPDGLPVRLVLLALTPGDDHETHLGILADVALRLGSESAVREAAQCTTLTEFRAFLRERPEGH